MSKLELLCVTMNQTDFSKLEEMNIHTNVLFTNQAGREAYDEIAFEGYTAKMLTTSTRGVGKNRNLGLIYASGDICLFADDDVRYRDDLEEVVLREFEACPDADIMIFNLDTDSDKRKQRHYDKTRKCGRFERMPWGGCRIAFRLNSVKKANLWFTTLFGGGCIFPAGEDSMWLADAKKAGLTFYVSKETVGTVSFEESSWFTGRDEKYYYGRGVYYEAVHPRTKFVWMLYFAFRTRDSKLSLKEKMKWMKIGLRGYREMKSFDEVISSISDKKTI